MDFSNLNPIILRRIIMDHYNSPLHKISDSAQLKTYLTSFEKSPSCIDELNLFIRLDADKIDDAKFSGVACSICVAAVDIIADQIIKQNVSDAKKTINNFLNMIENKDYDLNLLGESTALINTYKLPLRKKCARLGPDGFLKLIIG